MTAIHKLLCKLPNLIPFPLSVSFQSKDKFWYMFFLLLVIMFQCVVSDIFVFNAGSPPVVPVSTTPMPTLGPTVTNSTHNATTTAPHMVATHALDMISVSWWADWTGSRFSLKRLSNQYRKYHCGDKMVTRQIKQYIIPVPQYLHILKWHS